MSGRFPGYDPEIAEFVKSSDMSDSGLPAYLGLRTVEVGEGTMVAELDVRDDLLNPFGVAHGGVVSALVDHVLGAVLYPLMPRRSWAATRSSSCSGPAGPAWCSRRSIRTCPGGWP